MSIENHCLIPCPLSPFLSFVQASWKRCPAVVVACLVPLLLLMCPTVSAQFEIRNMPSAIETVSFRNDVMAVLSKAGCNAGTCHGNKNGKGGFKLSLRGQEPDVDYGTLTRGLFGRRVNMIETEQS